ncbi:bifunctional riboflavin kinase/FAD synthetase [Salibacteraceae bacterium]|nr:bifunctional riboflavin kinase/FAD synthetase [Salibacteraceae bacterium]
MKVYSNIEEFEPRENLVATVGTFDGVHLGHSYILNCLKAESEKINGESVLLTFYPHPRMVLFPENNDLKMLNTQEEKIELLDRSDLDHLIIHPFSREFSRLNSVEFVRDVLVNQIGISKLIIGYDHHFGRNREGTFEDLLELANLYDFEVEQIEAQEFKDTQVSSTKIRTAIEEGDMKTARHFLGYPFMISGKVVRGAGIGRTLGFKTANIGIKDRFKIIPDNGVYAVLVNIKGTSYKGMLNIGVRPSIKDAGGRSIEVHIFEMDEDLYGLEISVSLLEKIREEKKFENIDLLKQQLEFDKAKCEAILS